MKNKYKILKESMSISGSQQTNIIFNKDIDTNMIFVIGSGPGTGKNMTVQMMKQKHPKLEIINLRDVYYEFLQKKGYINNDEQVQSLDNNVIKKGLEFLYSYLLKLSNNKNKTYLVIGNNLLLLGVSYMKEQYMRLLNASVVIIIRSNQFKIQNNDILSNQKQPVNKLVQNLIREMIARGASYEVFSYKTEEIKSMMNTLISTKEGK